MEKEKRKRKAKWATCMWCERRRISPAFMSGKMKCLVKHMTECEAAYKIEQSCAERTKLDTVLLMMYHIKETVANLSSRVAVLEQRKARQSTDLGFWYKMTPRQAWKRRKENCVRVIRATLACFVPSRWCKTRLDYLEFMLIAGTGSGIADILSMALWPVLEFRDHGAYFRGIDTQDEYHLFKQVWGKKIDSTHNLDFWHEALKEVGLPLERFFDRIKHREHCHEFRRVILRFQQTAKRQGGGATSLQGLVGLCRVWRKLYPIPDQFMEVCRGLRPGLALKWKTEVPSDPCPSESGAVHVVSTSESGLQSHSAEHACSVEV